MMNSETEPQKAPPEDALERKRRELAGLQAQLADREVFLTSLRAEVAGFEGRYLREVGGLYAELDEWLAKMAEITAELIGSEESRTVAAEARAQAGETFAAAHGEAARIEEFRPRPDLKKLFREVCNQVHPDRAATEADRAVRERLMAEANVAYRAQDEAGLRRVMEEYLRRPEAVVGGSPEAELERVERQIERIRRRLEEIEKEIAMINSTEIARMMVKVHEALREGRDLLDDMARGLRLRIANLREVCKERSAGMRMR
jgi:hypothetical protein